MRTQSVLWNIHQSIPLGPLLSPPYRLAASLKPQENERKCNEVLRLWGTVTAWIQAKKNLRICAGWCNWVVNLVGDFTYQYLWDNQISNSRNAFSSRHSQQHLAKCKQTFEYSCLVAKARCHSSAKHRERINIVQSTTDSALNSTGISVKLLRCKRLPLRIFFKAYYGDN